MNKWKKGHFVKGERWHTVHKNRTCSTVHIFGVKFITHTNIYTAIYMSVSSMWLDFQFYLYGSIAFIDICIMCVGVGVHLSSFCGWWDDGGFGLCSIAVFSTHFKIPTLTLAYLAPRKAILCITDLNRNVTFFRWLTRPATDFVRVDSQSE